MPMKIALVTGSFLPTIGGAEFVVHHLAVQWMRQGHKVVVINFTADQPAHPDASYRVRKYTLLPGATRFGYHRFPFQWHAVRTLKKLLQEYKPDFISAHFGYPVGLWMARIRPVPRYLITCHGQDLTKLEQGYRHEHAIDTHLRDALNSSGGAVAISTYARKLMEDMGVRPSVILDIPNGVDVERFQKKVPRNLREQLSLPEDALIILSVGRNNPAKDYATGIQAFAAISATFPSAYYVIIGAGTSTLMPLSQELGIAGKLVCSEGLFGEDLIAAYQQADILFSPSIRELCPLVVLEGMAAGLPAVVTNVSGSQDLIRTGYNGIVVEPRQPAMMAEALRQMIEDKGLRRACCAANRDMAADYDWSIISKKYLEHA